MKKVFVIFIMISLFGINNLNANINIAYDYSFKDLDGQDIIDGMGLDGHITSQRLKGFAEAIRMMKE